MQSIFYFSACFAQLSSSAGSSWRFAARQLRPLPPDIFAWRIGDVVLLRQCLAACLFRLSPMSEVKKKSKMRRSACRLVMCGRIFFTWFIWWTYVKVAFETVVLLVRAVLTVADWLWKFTQRWDRVVVYSWILLCRTHQNPFWRAQTQRYGLHTTKRCPDQLLKVKRQS